MLKQDESKLKGVAGNDAAVLKKNKTLVGRLVEISGDAFVAAGPIRRSRKSGIG